MIKVEFSCDSRGNHRAELIDCISSSVKEFATAEEAINFFNQCTEPITQLSEIYPFKDNSKKKLSVSFIEF